MGVERPTARLIARHGDRVALLCHSYGSVLCGLAAPRLPVTDIAVFGSPGMDAASGAALLDQIYAAATRPENIYTHRWQIGDLLLWDNGFTMHHREPFDSGARRLMKRSTIILDPKRHIVPDGAPAELPAAA